MNTQQIKQLWSAITKPLSATERAVKELENARRNYLENKTHAEYYQSLCSFETQRITRLEKYLEPLPEPDPLPPQSDDSSPSRTRGKS